MEGQKLEVVREIVYLGVKEITGVWRRQKQESKPFGINRSCSQLPNKIAKPKGVHVREDL
jgi:hypothetical protein